jgi:hypothetical protein
MDTKKYLCPNILTIVLVLIVAFHTQSSKASHVMGSDITWEHLNANRYKVKYKAYRDCRGAPFSVAIQQISIRCVETGKSQNFTSTKTNITDITPVCNTTPFPCSPSNTAGTGDGVEQHSFELEINFDSSWLRQMVLEGGCTFEFITSECCVNGAVNTVSGGMFYSKSQINYCNILKTTSKKDNGPAFTSTPIAYACCNTPMYVNNGGADVIDGDSLAYSLVSVQRGNGVTANYNKKLSAEWPMTSYCSAPDSNGRCTPNPTSTPPEGFYFNTQTGDLIWTPTDCDETGAIVIQVEQWRKDSSGNNWISLGYTRREMQVRIVLCGNNNPPRIKNKYLDTICEGEKICVEIEAEDEVYSDSSFTQNWVDSLEILWTNTIAKASFEVDSLKFIQKDGKSYAIRTAKICWQTEIGDGREAPYPYFLILRDNACPRNLITSYGHQIKVNKYPYAVRKYTQNGLFLEFESSVSKLDSSLYNQSWVIRDSLNSNPPIYQSSNGKDTFRFSQEGTYIITYTISNPPNLCPTEYTDTILVKQTLVSINNTTLHESIKVYPNPASEYTTIDLGETYTKFKNHRLQIVNTLGQEIQSVTIQKQNIQIDTKNYPKGQYLINIIDPRNRNILTKKLMVQ